MLSQLTHAPPPYPLLTQKILLYTNYVKLTNPLVTGLLLQPPPLPLPPPKKKKKRFKLTFIPVGDRSIFITVGEMRRIIVATTEHLCIYLFFDSSILSMEDFVIFPPPSSSQPLQRVSVTIYFLTHKPISWSFTTVLLSRIRICFL